MATVEVKGLAELGNALKQFPEVLGKKYLARATYTAAALIADAAVSVARGNSRYPVAMQEIAKNISVFKRKNPDSSTAQYAVGVRRIKLSAKVKKTLRILRRAGQGIRIENDTFWWWWFENGTAQRMNKSGANRGRIEPQPFLRPAFESNKNGAIEVFRMTLADGVLAAAAEVSKK